MCNDLQRRGEAVQRAEPVDKITLGRWEAAKGLPPLVMAATQTSRDVVAVIYQVRNNGRAVPRKEQLANARVISATPELLELCESVLRLEDWLSQGAGWTLEEVMRCFAGPAHKAAAKYKGVPNDQQ